MFSNQFQTIKDVVKEFEIVENAIDLVYPIVFHLISSKTI